MNNKRFKIDNIGISITNISNTINVIDDSFKDGKLGYICVTNARTVYLANHDKDYCIIQNNSLLTVPDGIPLVWIAHNKGYKEVGKVSGKDLMDAIFEMSETKGYSHYFYGSTENTINLLTSSLTHKYPNFQIKGAVSPPFQPIESFNIEELAEEINKLKPSFFWCGLGAPKQERLIALLQTKLESTICVGVGLAFEYIAGSVKRSPKWMQKVGLEGVNRLIQQPQRVDFNLLIRYIYTLKLIILSFNPKWKK